MSERQIDKFESAKTYFLYEDKRQKAESNAREEIAKAVSTLSGDFDFKTFAQEVCGVDTISDPHIHKDIAIAVFWTANELGIIETTDGLNYHLVQQEENK